MEFQEVSLLSVPFEEIWVNIPGNLNRAGVLYLLAPQNIVKWILPPIALQKTQGGSSKTHSES